MTLTESRKQMQAWEYIEHAVVRYEFQPKIHVKNPWEKLAAAIILQTLLDAVHNYDFASMNEGWYWTLAGAIGIDVPYDILRDNMLIRRYVFNEPMPINATNWMDEVGRPKNTSASMEHNLKGSGCNGGNSDYICPDGDTDFSVNDLYDWTDNH